MLERASIPRLSAYARTIVHDRSASLDLARLTDDTHLDRNLSGRSVLIATRSQRASAVALVELDGRARRMTIAPPDLKPDQLVSVITDAEIDCIATDAAETVTELGPEIATIGDLRPRRDAGAAAHDTEWVLLTSGTSGRPKMVAHTLAGLVGAIAGTPTFGKDGREPVWATFYDIRRYGGLQIFLRAILGGTDLVLTGTDEPLNEQLHRLGTAGVTAISGTPSHWRRVLMSQERAAFKPAYIRLSGEIADQLVLDGLRTAYPDTKIGHAYASTEAGVGFAVDDGLEGFPASLIDKQTEELSMKLVDGSLRIRSLRAATRYIGSEAPSLIDADGFIDTGDLVEQRGERFYFAGRRGGIINVGGLKVNPEEVEATLNRHQAVRMSLVRARKNPLTGAIVVADIVLNEQVDDIDALKHDILESCRGRLERHKVPVMIRFVPSLELTAGGKLSRRNA